MADDSEYVPSSSTETEPDTEFDTESDTDVEAVLEITVVPIRMPHSYSPQIKRNKMAKQSHKKEDAEEMDKLTTLCKLVSLISTTNTGLEYDDKVENKTFEPGDETGSLDNEDDNEDEEDEDEDEEDEDGILQTLTEDDIDDIFTDVYYLIDQCFETKVLNMSSPTFYTDVQTDVTDTIYDEWCDAELCEDTPEEYEELKTLVGQAINAYCAFLRIPTRSIPQYNYKFRCQSQIQNATEPLSSKQMVECANTIQYLSNVPQPQQRTPEWYQTRANLISASNLWKVFGTESQQNSIIYEKCRPFNPNEKTFGAQSMQWGVKYEPITVAIYEDIFNTKLGEFGCIQHSRYSYIGASPDGINIDETNTMLYGRMVEIKNIFNREITGIPKLEYWIQTQIQMETCDLETCDFVETRIQEYPDEEAFYKDTESNYKGVVLSFYKNLSHNSTDNNLSHNSTDKNLSHEQSTSTLYKYMPLASSVVGMQPLASSVVGMQPLHIDITKDAVQSWIQQTKAECKTQNLILFSTAYWHLDEISCVLIERNKQWFEAAVPLIKKTWDIILQERVTGYEHRNTKKKITVTTTDASDSYMIQNMPQANSICLVKLG